MERSLTVILLLGLICAGFASAQTTLPLRVEGTLELPAAYGLSQLEKSLAAREVRLKRDSDAGSGRSLLVGVAAQGSSLAAWVKAGKLSLADTREALAVKRVRDGQNEVLAFVGSDAVGLMYALLEAAEEVAALPEGTDWFMAVREVSEQPANTMRRMRVLLHHEANERDWYHSPEYWDWYLDLLARNRFNGLNIVFSHQTPYMAPMYAWHVKVPEFPDVKVKGLTEEERLRNLESLRMIARFCKERGVELTIGIWQQLPWIRDFMKLGSDQTSYVEGLDSSNASEYSYLALKELLRQVPGIARIQLRTNRESGIPTDIQAQFYRDFVMKAITEASPMVHIDLRAVGFNDAVVEAAQQVDPGMRYSIKYCGEFMGLPYSAVQSVTRGYSYDDKLRRPFKYPIFNEIWVLGSHRVFLWGSENFGRRFGRNVSDGGTIGFETDGPLAQKGFQQPYSPAWRIFKNKDNEYYRWEIERYWAFFRSIGRFSYNPEADREVWLRPFRARFGEAGETVARAYEEASKVVGLIVASHINNITMYSWPEKSMGGLLGYYLDLNGTDKWYFPSINDQVAEELAGTLTGRPGPEGLAGEYESIAVGIEKALASEALGALKSNKEILSTHADFLMLASLARYHAHRQRECYRMARFYATGDVAETLIALAEAQQAVEEWRSLVSLSDRWYYERLQLGPGEDGHWKDRLFLVEKEPVLVQDAVHALHTYGLFDFGFDFGGQPMTNRTNIFRAWKYVNNYDIEPRFIGLSSHSRYSEQTGYGWVDNEGLEWTPMSSISRLQLSGEDPSPEVGLPRAALYSDFVSSRRPFSFRIDLPMEWHRLTFIFSDRSEKPRDHGPIDMILAERYGFSSLEKGIRVQAGKVVHYQTDRNSHGSRSPCEIIVLEPSEEGADAMLSGLVVSALRPHLGHAPIRRIDPGKDAVLSVTITLPPEEKEDGSLSASSAGRLADATLIWRMDPDGEWIRQALASRDGFVYTATVPAAMLRGKWLEYAFEATDRYGRVTRLPQSAERHGYFACLSADITPPRIEHEPLASATPGKPAVLRARVTDPDGVAVVRAYFRPLADIQPYEHITLEKRGDEYVGTIPGEIITPDYELIYFLDAVDEAGNGCFYPDWKTATPYVIVPVQR